MVKDISNYHSVSFCTDTKLRINSWGRNISGLTGHPFSAVKGKKYYEVLPRICHNDKDALSVVLENKRPLFLKGYSFNCFAGRLAVDITISPVRYSNGRSKMIKVFMSPPPCCAKAKELQSLQLFVDIGKIASTLAHGIRSPLNAIKGSVVYIMERFSGEPSILEFTKIMEDEISRLDKFISRFLSASLHEEEKISAVDINSLLKKIKAYMAFQSQANNIEIIYEYANVPKVSVNPFYIKHAILNVIDNSIDAMRGGGTLTVRTKSENLGGKEFVLVEISDTGPGMITDEINKFAAPKQKGKGFGLFITREVIQSHGGQMEIKSRKGVGTRVKLYLPATRVIY